MRFRRVRVLPLVVLMLLAGTVTIGSLLLHTPAFYARAAEPEGSERLDASTDLVLKELGPLVTSFVDGKGPWGFSFTQKQLNSFFEEDFKTFGDADHFSRIGITSPRVEVNDDQIRLGFRFGHGRWSTILSYDLKVWLAPKDDNVVVVEVQRRRAGALPLPSQQVFRELTEVGRRHNIDVTWYRHEGNPVAVIKLQSDRPRPTAHISRLDVTAGKILIQGVSFDPVQTSVEEPRQEEE